MPPSTTVTAAPPPAPSRVVPAAPRVITIASGKGGVGKTAVATNLALALRLAGQRTLLMDADLNLANVDLLLGLAPTLTVADVVAGRCTLADTLLAGPAGLWVVPAGSGRADMAALRPDQHAGLVDAVSALELPLDALVVDTAAGLGDGVLTFCQAAQDVVVVVSDEPASIADAYALIKVLGRDRGVRRVQVLANRVRDDAAGSAVFARLQRVVGRFLDVSVHHLGTVPSDEWLSRAVRGRRAVVDAYPCSPSARAFARIATRAAQWRLPDGAHGRTEFFVERLVRAACAAA